MNHYFAQNTKNENFIYEGMIMTLTWLCFEKVL